MTTPQKAPRDESAITAFNLTYGYTFSDDIAPWMIQSLIDHARMRGNEDLALELSFERYRRDQPVDDLAEKESAK